MSNQERISMYIQKYMQGVVHTTLNPKGPGVVRIHLIPPRNDLEELNENQTPPSVVIINGRDVIPINISWAILLNEFIRTLNKSVKYGKEVKKVELQEVVKETVLEVKKVFPSTRKATLKKDLLRIVNTFEDIAYGKQPREEIGYMSIGEYAPFMRAPHRMDLMVSSMEKDGQWHCNQKCIHCYAAGQPQATTKELSTVWWKFALDRLREIGVPQITFTGGEPTLREDLVELVDYSQWFVTRLNTNGINLTYKLCLELASASLDSVQVTLYSYDPKVHNKLVGAEMHHKTVSGIRNALRAGLNLSINTPLCTINRDYLNTLEFAHILGITYVSCSGLILTGNARKANSQETQLQSDELYEILKEAKKYCDDHGMEISFTSPGWISEDKLVDLGLSVPTCGAALSNMAINPYGFVVPCQSWLSEEPLGNIFDDVWNDIWDSERCKKIRENSAKMEGICPLRGKKQEVF